MTARWLLRAPDEELREILATTPDSDLDTEDMLRIRLELVARKKFGPARELGTRETSEAAA
jgi:hypothetical protein